jgi:hypothetical protein
MFEATFIIALCQHLLKQGYRTSDIVILSMYIQQVRLLKQVTSFWCKCLCKLKGYWNKAGCNAYFAFHHQLQSKEKELSSLAITSVDNFQGQESPIVIISLVRNNKGTIGFLRTSNRTCVALSRARNGKSSNVFLGGGFVDSSWGGRKSYFLLVLYSLQLSEHP